MDRFSGADLVVSKKKKKVNACMLWGEIASTKSSQPTFLVGVKNFIIFLVLETARRGQNNRAAARSLEETFLASYFLRLVTVTVT